MNSIKKNSSQISLSKSSWANKRTFLPMKMAFQSRTRGRQCSDSTPTWISRMNTSRTCSSRSISWTWRSNCFEKSSSKAKAIVFGESSTAQTSHLSPISLTPIRSIKTWNASLIATSMYHLPHAENIIWKYTVGWSAKCSAEEIALPWEAHRRIARSAKLAECQFIGETVKTGWKD